MIAKHCFYCGSTIKPRPHQYALCNQCIDNLQSTLNEVKFYNDEVEQGEINDEEPFFIFIQHLP